jgi:DNA-binding CsgD family transcriptional regulator
MLAEAFDAASFVGDVPGMVAAGAAARDVPSTGDRRAEFWRDLIVGLGDALRGRPDLAASRLTAVLAAVDGITDPLMIYHAGTAAVFLGDAATAGRLLQDAGRLFRAAGKTGDLPYVLVNVSALEESRGRYATARAISEEGLRLAEETGQDSARGMHLAALAVLAAIQGEEDACRRYVDLTVDLASPRAVGLPLARAGLALALLDLGAGRYTPAASRFAEMFAAPPGAGHPGVVLAVLPEWVEAAVRAGDPDRAAQTLALLESLTAHADDTAQAAVLCCRALLTEDADGLFAEALVLQARAGTPLPQVARTHLLYGEWLRRTRQRTRSREQLRAALEAYEQLGARPWAARARAELRASGETLRRRDEAGTAALTPQELRIAQSVAQGRSTRDIAAALFLSPRTVEYHLYKIFPKLGVTSRAELVKVVSDRPGLVDVR